MMVYLFALFFLFAPFATVAAQSIESVEPEKKPFRIAIVLWRGETDIDKNFKQHFSLKKIDVEFEHFYAKSNKDNLPDIVTQIKAQKPDLIFSWGTTVTEKLVGSYESFKQGDSSYIRDIPVVFTIVSYPFDKLAVDKYSGRNITGSSHLASLSNQINAIRNYKDFKRLGIIYNSEEGNSKANVKELRELAEQEQFVFIDRSIPLDAKGQPIPEMIPSVLEDIAEQVDVLYMGPDSFTAGTHQQVTTLTALWLKLMTFSSTESAIEKEGGYASIGLVSTYKSLGQFAAYQAEQILLQGKKPGEIPIEPLKKFTFIVNTPSINYLGIYPPLSVTGYAKYQKRDEHLEIVKKLENKTPLTFPLPPNLLPSP
jgi:putative tryptophan/tyrosine transport system substrate-binding protein